MSRELLARMPPQSQLRTSDLALADEPHASYLDLTIGPWRTLSLE